MKKLLKTVVLLSCLLVAFGCKNNFAPTAVNEDAFKPNVAEGNASVSIDDLMLNKIEIEPGDDTDITSIVTVKFNMPLAPSSKDGVKLYKLTDATKDIQMPKKVLLTGKAEVIGNKVIISGVKLKGIEHLYAYVTASKIKAVNGQLMNQDEDTKYGEPDDDDYAYYQKLGGSSLKGNVNFDKECSDYNMTVADMSISPSFKYGEGRDAHIVKSIEIEATSLIDKAGAYGLDGNTFASVLNNYVKFEQYDYIKDVCTEISTSFKFVPEKAPEPAKWVCALALKPHHTFRFKLINLDKVNIDVPNLGYKLKSSLDCDMEKIIFSDFEFAGHNYEIDQLGKGGLILDKSTFPKGYVTLKFTLPPDLGEIYKDKKVFLISTKDKDGKYKTFTGFDPATIVKENFRLFDKNDREIAVKEVRILPTVITAIDQKAEVAICFDNDGLGDVPVLLMSPKVKIKGFTGSYNDGTKDINYNIPDLKFTNFKPIEDIRLKGGWQKF